MSDDDDGSDHPIGSPQHKAAVTRAANRHLEELTETTEAIRSDLDLEPPLPPVGESDEDIVVHRSDDHIGQVHRDDRGRVMYDTDIAVDRIRAVTARVMRLAARESRNRTIGTCYLLMGGDHVTGECIYAHQPHEIDRTLDEQIMTASELYYEQIERLSRAFERVVVVCTPGNHGELRADGASESANADGIVFINLELMVRVSSINNVQIVRSESARYINHEIRGHRAHLRHGQDSLLHVGTSSGKQRWQSWAMQHDFDIAYRGHYHEFRLEYLMNIPILMSGSICPPEGFEESLAVWSEPAATIHGVSDENVLTWIYPVYFEGRHHMAAR